MPRASVPPVEALRVARVALAEGAGKRIGPLGDRHQMNVIRHQAVAKQRNAVALRAFAESFEIETPVVVEQEDVLAIVAPLRDVMRHTRRHRPRPKRRKLKIPESRSFQRNSGRPLAKPWPLTSRRAVFPSVPAPEDVL